MAREEEIEEILVDSYGPDEQAASWGVAFEDGVPVPFKATLLDIEVTVSGFRTSHSNAIQCRVRNQTRELWIGAEYLDTEGLPADFLHLLDLYGSWGGGSD